MNDSGVIWKDKEGQLLPYITRRDGSLQEVAWAPQEGSQTAFYECPLYEVNYCGTRGPGKTDVLLMDFGRHCGPEKLDGNGVKVAGWGAEWRGILFRQTYPQLADIVAKTRKWFPRIFPDATFSEQKMTWKWSTGEELLLRHMLKEDDYWNYHGHAYPWIGWEELTTWKDDKCYKVMMACSRSTMPGMPRKYRATCNPYGIGHNWVKSRFQIRTRRWPDILGTIIDYDSKDFPEGMEVPQRVAIHGFLCENKVLLHADPGYEARLREAARNPSELAAWLEGSWDIVAGGMFDDVWSPSHHIVSNFEVPHSWEIQRAFDWGSSKPFSVGWWARSDGTDYMARGKRYSTVPGDLFRVAEWYGWNGQPNEGLKMISRDIALGILDREKRLFSGRRINPGPADGSIYDKIENSSIGDEMMAVGVYWTRADKSPGSRTQGWEKMRSMLKQSTQRPREEAGMFVCEGCHQFIRTVPVLPRDEKNLDDVDTDAEDHIGDESRYMALTRSQRLGVTPLEGR